MSTYQQPLPEEGVRGQEQAMDEMSWLVQRQQQLEALQGGLLPAVVNIKGMHRVLDVACGAGIWTQAFAARYPHVQVIGVESHVHAIEQARMYLPEGIDNVKYFTQNIHTLGNGMFANASFDLIHLRFLEAQVTSSQFSPLLHILHSLCRRGGCLVWSEAELPLTTSAACDYLESLLLTALEGEQRAFSPGFSLSLGIGSRMQWWLYEARFVLKHNVGETLMINAGTPQHVLFVYELERFAHAIRPFLLHANVIPAPDYDALMMQLHEEIRQRDFQGVFRLRSMVAYKI